MRHVAITAAPSCAVVREHEQTLEGFAFRFSEDVLLECCALDAYNEAGSLDDCATEPSVRHVQG
jgi:hypothetical protein